MFKKISMKILFSLFMFAWLFWVLGVYTNSWYAIGWWFGDTEWVWSDKGWEEVKVYWSKDKVDDSLITSIKKFINWTLRILALITLIILLWWWFQMLLAAGDENKYKKGWTILKQAAIALAFIGLSWIIVSFIFWIIDKVGTWAAGNS